AWLEPREPIFRDRGDEVVAALARELEKFARNGRAHHMQAVVLGPGVTAAVAIETGERLHRTGSYRSPEHVLVVVGDSDLLRTISQLSIYTERATARKKRIEHGRKH